MDARCTYVLDQVRRHARQYFSETAFEQLSRTAIVIGPTSGISSVHTPTILIPSDYEFAPDQYQPYEVPFNGTTVRLPGLVEPPDRSQWSAWPSDNHPLWYRNDSGCLIPAWDMFNSLFDLLTFGEEQRDSRRDHHGRYVGAYSARSDHGLLETPLFNDAVGLIVAAAVGLREAGHPLISMEDHVRPPVVVLSHDCDLLRGNDRWTQAVRTYRIVEPLRRGRFPRLNNLWWIARNLCCSRSFYLDNIDGLVTLERQFGFQSTFYLLNGTRGRFGARSGPRLIPDALRRIPEGWDVGVHYNFDTHLDAVRLEEQIADLEQLTNRKFFAGRAHYLRFDSRRSPGLYESAGIQVDESAGYPDCIGYRCGIGGCFHVWDEASTTARALVELPLMVMDSTLLRQYGEQGPSAFKRHLDHLVGVGGAMSLIFHPGLFFNPEFPEYRHLYNQLLQQMRSVGATSKTAHELGQEFSSPLGETSI